MIKKIFALASVSALTGLVSAAAAAGCSSNEEPKGSASDGAPPPTQTNDGGDDTEGREPGSRPNDTQSCMETRAIDMTRFPYARAKRAANACTTQELDEISAFFRTKAQNAQDIVISDWAKSVSEGCAACVFSDGTGAEWTPILTKGDKLDDVNRGGCIEIASGKEACGRSYQHVAECRLEACSNTCDTAEGFTACLQDVQGIFSGPCKGAYDALERDCGTNELPTYEAACKGTAFTFEGPIRVQCINGGVSQ
ncbi:MAG: hypothetical protein KIS78_10050 [Labilithrix sp.]|nr:hypothetical protein [Labilithrix sp.]MCW5832740.1 hypothetical protein [Labilithrix sp.]